MTTNVVSTTLSSAAGTSPVLGKAFHVQLYDSSSFMGTWQVQRRLGGTWYVLNDPDTSSGYAQGTQSDLPYGKDIDAAKSGEYRVAVSAYTSGTLGVEIA